MWSCYRGLQADIEGLLVPEPFDEEERQTLSDRIHEFQSKLMSNLFEFVSISKNWNKNVAVDTSPNAFIYASSKNPADRKNVENANKDLKTRVAVTLGPALKDKFVKKEDIDAAILLSDLLDLSEVTCLGLVLEAHSSQASFPRGTKQVFNALYLYHEAKDALFNVLSILLTARRGRTYGEVFSAQFHEMADNFISDLPDLTTSLLVLASKASLEDELKKYEDAKVFATPSERTALSKIIEARIEALADCIFNLVCQSSVSTTEPPSPPLPAREATLLVRLLMEMEDPARKPVAREGDTSMSDSQKKPLGFGYLTVSLLVSTLYALDLVIYGDRLVEQNPLLNEGSELRRILFDQKGAMNPWKNNDLRNVVMLAWGAALKDSSDDQMIFDLALSSRVFSIIEKSVLSSRQFTARCSFHVFFMDAIHNLLTRVLDLHFTTAGQVEALLGGSDDDPKEAYLDLLGLVARLYGTHYAPEASAEQWGRWSSFIRLCGGDVHPQAYIPYLEMIRAFAGPGDGAMSVYQFLMENGRPGYKTLVVSWRVLFEAVRTYADEFLTMHDAQHSPPKMDPVHVEMLSAFLRILSAVVKNNEVVRIELFENREFDAFNNLVRLLSTSVPAVLKAEILQCLTSFSLLGEGAALAWTCLVQYGILPRDGFKGICSELKEEDNAKTYPETIAFVELLHTILPYMPGVFSGANLARVGPGELPSFSHILSFLAECLVSLNHRNYNDVDEKWLLAEGILQIFIYLLEMYTPEESHFENNNKRNQIAEGTPSPGADPAERFPPLVGLPAAGYLLMECLLADQKQVLLALLFFLEQVANDKATDTAHTAALRSLRLLELLFQKEALFVLKDKLVQKIEDLLVQVHNNSPAHLWTLFSLIDISHSSELALGSIKLLWWLTKTTTKAQLLFVRMLQNDGVGLRRVISSFESRLRDIQHEQYTSNENLPYTDVTNEAYPKAEQAIVFSILHLILYSLSLPAPNFAHLLVGFPVSASHPRDIAKATIFAPGEGKAQSCFHVMVDLLVQHRTTSDALLFTHPRLAALILKTLYRLCWDKATSTPILQYLENQTFFYKQIESLSPIPSRAIGLAYSSDRRHSARLNAQGWLLKLIALELYLASRTRDRTHARMFAVLFGRSSSTSGFGETGDSVDPYEAVQAPRLRILQLLDALDISPAVLSPSSPELREFDLVRVNELFQDCTSVVEGTEDVQWCDLERLRSVLVAEAEAAVGANISQGVFDEISMILAAAMELNFSTEIHSAMLNFFKGWQRLLEVALLNFPHLLHGDERLQVISEVLGEVVGKSRMEGLGTRLLTSMSGASLMIIAAMKQAVSLGSVEGVRAFVGDDEEGGHGSLERGRMGHVVSAVIDSILQTDLHPKVRINYYSTLLVYILILQEHKRGFSLGWLYERAELFMATVARDSLDTQGLDAILVVSVLAALVGEGTGEGVVWSAFLHSHGHIQAFVAQLCMADDDLVACLAPQPKSLDALYVFQARMVLVQRLALSSTGASMLLDAGLVPSLMACRFLFARPLTSDPIPQNMMQEVDFLISPPIERYRELLIPVLKALSTLVDVRGAMQLDIALHVVHFVASHFDTTFKFVLRERTNASTPSGLEELALVTGIIRHLARRELRPVALSSLPQYQKLPSLMVAVFIKFVDRDSWRQAVGYSSYGRADQFVLDSHVRTVLANVSRFFSATLSSTGGEAGIEGLLSFEGMEALFRPSLSLQVVDAWGSKPNSAYSCPLGVVIRHLENAKVEYEATKMAEQKAHDNLARIDDLSSEELSEILGTNEAMTKPERVSRARPLLASLVASLQTARDMWLFVIENLLFVLWRHLDYFLNSKLSLKTVSSSLDTRPPSSPRVLEVGAEGRAMHRLGSISAKPVALNVSGMPSNTSADAMAFSVADIVTLRQELAASPSFVAHDGILALLEQEEKAVYKNQRLPRVIIQPLTRRIADLVRGVHKIDSRFL